MTAPQHERLELVIHGSVQGVGFRYRAQAEARRLALAGEVRNLPGGAVAAVAEGERQALEELLAWCKVGPPGARVDEVEVRWTSARGELPGFSIGR